MEHEFNKLTLNCKVIILDSGDVTGDTTDFAFTYKLPNHIRNVTAIKNISTYMNVDINTTSSSYLKNSKLDMIYISLNNYNNIDIGNIDDAHDKPPIFASIEHDINNRIDTNVINSIKYVCGGELRTDTDSYYANPIIPEIREFTVKLYKSDGTSVKKQDVKRLIMKIAVYNTFGKVAMN
jgi:hypothetical protein